MHKFLLTSALVIPFSLGTALAQDTATPPADPVEPAPTTPMDTPAPADPVTPVTPVDDPAAPADSLSTEMAASDKVVHQQSATELRLDWITGASVHSVTPDGEKVGDITDLILDGTTGQMSAAIIGVGGFLGIGQKQIAVAWDRLNINYDAREVTTDLTRDEANAAPEYVFRQQDAAPAADGTVAPGTAPMDPATDPATPVDPAAPAADPTAPVVDPVPTTTEPAVGETEGDGVIIEEEVEPVTPADGTLNPETETTPAPSN